MTMTIKKEGQTISFKPASQITSATTTSFPLSESFTSVLPINYTSSATNLISIFGTTATL